MTSRQMRMEKELTKDCDDSVFSFKKPSLVAGIARGVAQRGMGGERAAIRMSDFAVVDEGETVVFSWCRASESATTRAMLSAGETRRLRRVRAI